VRVDETAQAGKKNIKRRPDEVRLTVFLAITTHIMTKKEDLT